MTWMALVQTIIWASVAVYTVRIVQQTVMQFAPTPPVADTSTIAPSDIPEDLMAVAMQETEVWAQEEVVRVIQERYEALKDWNRVRSAMGVGIRLEA